VATVGSELDHTIARPVNTPPAESRTTADACAVCPTTNDDGETETEMVEIGTSDTDKLDVPTTPSLVARMAVTPGESAVTMPLPDTTATDELVDDHTIARPFNALPAASRTTAVAAAL